MKCLLLVILLSIPSAAWAGSPQATFYRILETDTLLCEQQSELFHALDQLGRGSEGYPKLIVCTTQAESEGKKAYQALLVHSTKLKVPATSALSTYLTYLRFMLTASSQEQLEASSQKADSVKALSTFEVEAGL